MRLVVPVGRPLAALAALLVASVAAEGQDKPVDPSVQAREYRVAQRVIDNIHDAAKAALARNDCVKYDSLRAQLSSFSESPNAIALAAGSRPGELRQGQLLELSAYAGLRRENLRERCPQVALDTEPSRAGSQKAPEIRSVETPPKPASDSSAPSAPLPGDQSFGVIFISGFDKEGHWYSGDFGRTRYYPDKNKSTFDNEIIDDDELIPPWVICAKGKCKLDKKDSQAVSTGGNNTAQSKTARVHDVSVSAPATKGGSSSLTKGGLAKTFDTTKSGPAGKQESAGTTKASGVKARATKPMHLANAMSWLFLDEPIDKAGMTKIDPPRVVLDNPAATEQQGQNQLKVVNAAEALIRDAYTSALDGTVDPVVSTYVIENVTSDAGLRLISERTLNGEVVELTLEQRARLSNFAAVRIKDMQISATDQPQAGDGKAGSLQGGKPTAKQGKQPSSSNAVRSTKATKQPAQAKSVPSQSNALGEQIGQQILQGVIQGGIQYGINRLSGGGGSSHRSEAPALKKSGGQGSQSGSAPSAGGSLAPAPSSGPIKFYGVTGPSR